MTHDAWFCGKCGTRNLSEDSFCVGCGAARRRPGALAVPTAVVRRNETDGDADQSVLTEADFHDAPEGSISSGRELPESVRTAANLHDAQATYYRVKSLQVATQIVQPRQSTLALLAVLCAVGGLIAVFVIGPGAILPEAAAVVLGHLALREIRHGEGHISGGGLAIAALLIGYFSLGLGVLAIAGLVALLSS